MKKITSVAFIMLAALSLEAQSPASNRTTQQEREAAFKNASLDVPYCDRSEAQKLDVFLPVNGEGPFPVIIYVHGGGWNSQDKSRTKHFLYSPLQNGYATVTINYRLSGEAIFPAQVHDLKAAIRWVKANAAEYGFDAGRIILWGDSAGGHLVALAGTSGGAAELEDMSMGNDGYDSRVNAVIDYFGVTNFYKMDEYKVKEGGESSLDSSTGSMAQLMGAPISQIPDKVRMADPTTFISKDGRFRRRP